MNRFENPARVAEMNPSVTLQRIGLHDGGILCDIGAGSGVFAVPAARMTTNTVYALEISDEMISILREKTVEEGLPNLRAIKVQGKDFGVADSTADVVLLATVLHEIKDRPVFLKSVKRLMNRHGRTAVIEFHKRETPMGPPLAHRLGRDETASEMQEAGFALVDDFDLGPNFYCLVFSAAQ
jgi:ubiquinone/menaquinone biosynthesis C-methylase UbiE